VRTNSISRNLIGEFALLVIVTGVLGCHRSGVSLSEKRLVPAGLAIRGQVATVRESPLHRMFRIPSVEKTVDLGLGLRVSAMTFGGTIPGPAIETTVGDTVTLEVPNQGAVSHGLDTHAFLIDSALFGPVPPGKTLSITRPVTTPGVYIYHCAAGPVTDYHIKSGMYGAMIVYPRELFRPAKELVVVESALYDKPNANGLIIQDPADTATNVPFVMMFNGRLEHESISVSVGQLVRVYFVNVGPGTSAFHVIGTSLDRFYPSGNPRNVLYDVQTASVPPGGGAIAEFRIPEKGTYLLVDHDNLRFLPYGFALAFVAQ
jgi:nitrite reductase (NO-forming)